MLYALLLDRMGLSMRNGWLDEEGRVYIYYTLDEIQEDLNCGHDKAVKLLKELDTQNGIGLIERIKQGQGKPAKIYVRQFSKNDAPDSPDGNQNELSLPESRKPDSEKQDIISSEKQESWLREIRSTDCGKTDGNNIDKNYTENSYVRHFSRGRYKCVSVPASMAFVKHKRPCSGESNPHTEYVSP